MKRTRNSKKLVHGYGRKGDGISKINGKLTKAYQTWINMLKRCYSTNCQVHQPTYIDCKVWDEWLYFPTFKTWYDENYIDGCQLDKDLLVNGNKIYAPHTCIFVPQAINLLFVDRGRSRGEYPIGVCFRKDKGKFAAYGKVDGRTQYLGYFGNVEDAHKAYIVAKKANVVRMANEWRDRIQPKLYEALIRKANELI